MANQGTKPGHGPSAGHGQTSVGRSTEGVSCAVGFERTKGRRDSSWRSRSRAISPLRMSLVLHRLPGEGRAQHALTFRVRDSCCKLRNPNHCSVSAADMQASQRGASVERPRERCCYSTWTLFQNARCFWLRRDGQNFAAHHEVLQHSQQSGQEVP